MTEPRSRAALEPTGPRPDPDEPVGRPPLRGARVLVVDDVPAVARSTARLLEHFGARAVAVDSGAEALARLEAAPWDLLIVDVGLPDLDGLAVLARARVLQPGLPAILVSGLPRPTTAALNEPTAAFLGKPFPLSKLLAAAEAALAPPS
ncbi:MAG: response regulator [Planctomycetes bacterium]|nr:response regulator [Planctomycetota bacterium]